MVSVDALIWMASAERRKRCLGQTELYDAMSIPVSQREAVRKHGLLGGVIGILPIEPQGEFFEVVEGGEPAAVLGAYQYLNDHPIDLIAIRLDDPRKFYRLLGVANALGQPAIDLARRESVPSLKTEPVTLTVHETPLDWLRSGCEGACILNGRRTPTLLADIDQVIPSPAPFAPTLHKLLHQQPPHLPRLMVPESESLAA